MSPVISLVLKLFVCVVAVSFFISESEGVNPPFGNRHATNRRLISSSNNNNNRSLGRVAALQRTGGKSQHQRDEGSSKGLVMNDQPMVHDFDEEEERYVPASFNIEDYGADTGNRFFNGHAIEMMPPVEVPEYGWNEDSRGLSELENGGDVQPVNHGNNDEDEEYYFSTPAAAHGSLDECGGKEIDPTYALCCSGLVFRKLAHDQGKCCGSVAYDDRYFTCCQGRAIVRKAPQMPLCCGDYTTDSLPDQCRFGYERDSTGLGSTCCRSATGSWTCCLKGESCCTGSAVDRSTAIEVPGFRPACCHLNNEDLTAQCCATTYEKIRVLPDCCERDRLKPVCCQTKDRSRPIKCCPGTIGYCCGSEERPVQPTVIIPPEFRLQSTRAPSFTYPPRPSYTQRPPIDPRPSYTQRPPIDPRPSYTQRPPVDPRPSYTQRPPIDPRPSYTQRPPVDPRPSYTQRPPVDPRPSYTQRPPIDPRPTHAPGSSYTTGYPFPIPGQSVTPRDHFLHSTAALPLCCIKKAPVRQCCSGATKSPACCQSAKLQARTCCLTFSFNPTCCRTHMQQQQQQQLQQQPQQQPQHLPAERFVIDSTNNSATADVIPIDAIHTAERDGNHEEPIHPAPHDAHRGDPRQPYQPSSSSDTRNGHPSRGGPPPPPASGLSNGRSTTDGRLTDSGLQAERRKVAHSCCRLGSRAATACCQDGYKETGRLPACCVSSPVDNQEQNDADPTMLNQGSNQRSNQELRLYASDSPQVTRKPRRVGQKNSQKDTQANAGSSKVATGRKVKATATSGRPCNETTFAEDEFICCNNVLRKRIGVSPSCCNTIAYDQLLYMCCDGKVRVSCRPDYKPKKSVWGVSV